MSSTVQRHRDGTDENDEPTRGTIDAPKPRTVAESDSGLEVKTLDSIRSIEPERWNGVVDRATRGSVFHRYEWQDAIENGIGHEPKHLVVEKDGNPIGVYPNVIVDIPKTPFRRLTSVYPGFGGPLLTTDVKESLSLVTDAVSNYCTGRTVVHEIRARDTSFLRYNDFLKSKGYRSTRTGCRFLLHLEKGYDRLLENMSRSRRRGIERGREIDHELTETPVTRETLERFYRVYEREIERRGGDPHPWAFFERLLEMKSRILLVSLRIEGEYTGGFLELKNDEQRSLHGFLAAVPPEYFEYHASELCYDFVIRWGIEHGYETYDFGDTGTDFEDGVYRFKEGFGGQAVPNVFWERGCSPAWKAINAGRSLYWRYSR